MKGQLLEQLASFFKNLSIESKTCLECVQKLKRLENNDPIQINSQKSIKRPVGGYTRFLKDKAASKKWRSMSKYERQPYMDELRREQEEYRKKKLKKNNQDDYERTENTQAERQVDENEENKQIEVIKHEDLDHEIFLE